MESNVHVLYLFLRPVLMADKWWIPHNKIQLTGRDHLIPIHPEGISFMDVGIGLQRQRVQIETGDVLGLFHHLALGYPEGSLGYGAGEDVNLNPIELIDANLDRVCKFTDDAVAVKDDSQGLILQPSE